MVSDAGSSEYNSVSFTNVCSERHYCSRSAMLKERHLSQSKDGRGSRSVSNSNSEGMIELS